MWEDYQQILIERDERDMVYGLEEWSDEELLDEELLNDDNENHL